MLVARGLVESRAKAHALIRAGDVFVDGQRIDKPGALVPNTSEVALSRRLPYVSRAGDKLAAALDEFSIDPKDRTCLDVGASTGGFTDCLLQRGARLVYAVDVGRAQLAWSLRQDARVVNMERTDIRRVDKLPEEVSLACVDVAFISVRKVLPVVRRLICDGGVAVVLIKPQFEAGRGQVGRRGLVTDPTVHRQVLQQVLSHAANDGWRIGGAMASPITGATGNREFLALLAMPGCRIEQVDVGIAIDAAMWDETER